MAHARTILELKAGPLAPEDLRVVRVHGREALSEPFQLQVEFERRDGEPVALADVIGQEAQLTLRRADGAERIVHGLVGAVSLVEVRAGRPWYRARVVPRLALLAHKRSSRVFQDESVPDIVQAVLGEGEVACRLALSGSYPPREYCLQYRETDLAFVQRLLEEEGISYFFEHADGSHTLVLADAPGAFSDLAGGATLPFRPPHPSGDEAEEEHVTAIARADRAQVAKVTLRDFDFTRPALDLTASASEGEGPEEYEYRLRYGEPGEQRRLAAARLEGVRRKLLDFEGQTSCLRLVPGACFELSDHPDPGLAQRLAVLEVVTEARQEEAAGSAEAISHHTRNWFVARLAADPIRPPQRAARPIIRGAQTATVVGPAGEEIHTDEHGRVKIQFHWDREGPKDDHASCFVRVAQSWAGPGFGALYLPRIGHEVLVRFLDGDPDRPLITASLYNGAHVPPVELPAERTQSTLRSDSSPGSGGANELRFEDAQGQEELTLHAQKDETIAVENDKNQRVGASEALEVGKDRTIEVAGNQRLAVELLDRSEIGGNQSLTVSGNRTTAVTFRHQESVGVAQSVQVGGSRNLLVGVASAETVGLAAAVTVGGAMAVSVAGMMNEAVGALRASQVGAARVEMVGLSRQERVGKDMSVRTGGDAVAEVSGTVAVSVAKDLTETVTKKTGIEVKEPFGLVAKTIRLEGDSEVRVVVGGKLLLSVKSSGVTFSAKTFTSDAETKVKGSTVKISGGAGPKSQGVQVARLEPLTGESAFVQVEVADSQGNPVANELVRVEFADGTVKEAKLDGSGKAKVSGPKPGSAKVSLPNVDTAVWKLG